MTVTVTNADPVGESAALRRIAVWMGAAFCAALLLAALVLAVAGVHETGILDALRATARWSYALFWPAYTASAMAALFGPTFEPLAQRGRELGLAFAAAHLVHVGLVVWLYRISAQPPVTNGTFLIFGIAVVWTYGLAALSIGSIARALGRRRCRILRTVGVEYIALAFAIDFVRSPRGNAGHLVAYLPFTALAIAGPGLRLSALLLRARRAAGNPTGAPWLSRLFASALDRQARVRQAAQEPPHLSNGEAVTDGVPHACPLPTITTPAGRQSDAARGPPATRA